MFCIVVPSVTHLDHWLRSGPPHEHVHVTHLRCAHPWVVDALRSRDPTRKREARALLASVTACTGWQYCVRSWSRRTPACGDMWLTAKESTAGTAGKEISAPSLFLAVLYYLASTPAWCSLNRGGSESDDDPGRISANLYCCMRRGHERVHDCGSLAKCDPLPCSGPDTAFSSRLERVENTYKKLTTATAYISTLGGGHFLCKQVNQALRMAAAQMSVACALRDDRLLARCGVHVVYVCVQVGLFRTAVRGLRVLRRIAQGRRQHRAHALTAFQRLDTQLRRPDHTWQSRQLAELQAVVAQLLLRPSDSVDHVLAGMVTAARHYTRRTFELWKGGHLHIKRQSSSYFAAAAARTGTSAPGGVDEYYRQRFAPKLS